MDDRRRTSAAPIPQKPRGPPKIAGINEKHWKLAAESTSAAILAKETLVPPKKPGLDRQPKTLNAQGIGAMMKHKNKGKSLKSLHSGSSIGDEGPRRATNIRKSSARRSRSSITLSRQFSKVSRRDSGDMLDSGSGAGGSRHSRGTDDEDNWELFAADTEAFEGELLEEKEPSFEMAVVEIDVNDAQDEMDRMLKRMHKEGRTTERERTVLADTFTMFLQGLVHLQEGEVESIDHLQTKTGILQTINFFVQAAEDLTKSVLHESEEKIEEEEGHGILDSLNAGAPPVEEERADKSPEGEEGGERKTPPAKTIQGISVDEMNATTLRETYLNQRNKLDMQAHLKTINVIELKQVQFEKTLLELHYSKMVKPADLQREMRDLRKTVTDLQMELSEIQQETASIQSDIATQEKGLHEDEVATGRLDLEMLTKQMDVQQNANKPLHLAKEADKEAHKLEQVSDNLDVLYGRWMGGVETIKTLQDQIDQKSAELQLLVKDETKMYQHRRLSLHDAETLTTDMEILLKKEQNLLDKCAACQESIFMAGRTRKKLNEELHHIHNGTNKAQREYQRLDRLVKMSHDAYTNSKLAYEKMRSAFDSTKPKDDSNNWEKLSKMFQREITNLKMALSSKVEEAAYNSNKVEVLQSKLNELYDEQIECGKELQDLIRTTVRKRRERQEKSEQCIKLEAQVQRLGSDKKMQQLVLQDCGRSERDLHKMMSVLRKKYAQLKIERGSLMNDLIVARQKLSEQTEKVKICSNEIDSYNNQLLDRTRELQRAHYLNLNAGLARDSVKNDALRSILAYRTHRNERGELQLCNNTLRKEIKTQQNEIVQIRENFEASIHESNRVAVSLRERTEEVCTFTERIKAYEIIILKGSSELTMRELERNKLQAMLDEVKKHLLIVTTNQPDESKLIYKIEMLRNRVYQITRERMDLEDNVNNVRDENRRREIRHDLMLKRETPELLEVRLNGLEHALASRDCLSLERELILKQVDDFTNDAVRKATFLKDHYAQEVKMLVGLRKSLYHTSNRIDGMICETSLATAKAEAAEARYEKLKLAVEIAEARGTDGLSPTEEMQAEFSHILWREEMIRRSKNRPPGFLFKKKPLSGSQIVMERMRPKPKAIFPNPATIPTPIVQVPKECKKQVYRVLKFGNLKKTKAHLLRSKTGLPLCNGMTTF